MDMNIIQEYKGQTIYIFSHLDTSGWLIMVQLDNGVVWKDDRAFVGSLDEVGQEGVKRGRQLIDNRF